MKHTTPTLAIACILVACGSNDPVAATGTATSVSSSTSAGTGGAGGATSSTGGAGQGGEATGGGGQGGAGGAPCELQAKNLLDLSASYEVPGLPFELASASASPLAAVASLPSSSIHHWDFDPNVGSNDVAAVTLELTCHGAGSSDLGLSVVRGRFQGGGWSYQDEGEAVGCGQTASFSINKPPGPEPSYFYRVAFSASLSCTSPHLELHLVTVGHNGQLRFAKRINSNDETIDCGESSPYGIQFHQGQADRFALVTVKETYQPDGDGALEIPYSVVIQ